MALFALNFESGTKHITLKFNPKAVKWATLGEIEVHFGYIPKERQLQIFLVNMSLLIHAPPALFSCTLNLLNAFN